MPDYNAEQNFAWVMETCGTMTGAALSPYCLIIFAMYPHAQGSATYHFVRNVAEDHIVKARRAFIARSEKEKGAFAQGAVIPHKFN